MRLQKVISKYIADECSKLLARHHAYHNALHLEYVRNVKRVKDAPPKIVKVPNYWKERLYNPFYVNKHIDAISLAIAKKIKSDKYSPNPPHEKEIPKPGGGLRKICIYQIPDASVSKYIYNSLMNKNRHRLSSFSYAYRRDRNVHYAIQDIAVDLQQYDRLFISEFDFSDFFGSIDHNYLFEQFEKNGFLISPAETNIIKRFLPLGESGIPLGTSISLFLANLACWKMDSILEREGVKFARYADDTIVWSNSYEKICASYEIIKEFSNQAGVRINFDKSDGISLLTKPGLPSEMVKTKDKFNFLGYCLSVDKVSIKEKSIKKIKAHISYLLYRHLIQPISTSRLRAVEIPRDDRDRDLVVAIQQIRRYMYGNLSEKILSDYLAGRIAKISFKGLMSFYPLVTDEGQLRELDGWLVHTIRLSVRKRLKLLTHHGYGRLSSRFPFNVKDDQVVEEFAKNKLYRIPSFLRIYNAVKKGIVTGGLGFSDNYQY